MTRAVSIEERGAWLRLVRRLKDEGQRGTSGRPWRGGRHARRARAKQRARFYLGLASPANDIIASCPIGGHWHTNPDGSRIFIRALRIKERSYWDWTLEEFVAQKAREEAQQRRPFED